MGTLWKEEGGSRPEQKPLWTGLRDHRTPGSSIKGYQEVRVGGGEKTKGDSERARLKWVPYPFRRVDRSKSQKRGGELPEKEELEPSGVSSAQKGREKTTAVGIR